MTHVMRLFLSSPGHSVKLDGILEYVITTFVFVKNVSKRWAAKRNQKRSPIKHETPNQSKTVDPNRTRPKWSLRLRKIDYCFQYYGTYREYVESQLRNKSEIPPSDPTENGRILGTSRPQIEREYDFRIFKIC